MPEIIYPSRKNCPVTLKTAASGLAASLINLIILFGYGQQALAGTFPDSGPGLAIESYNPKNSENNLKGEVEPNQALSVLRYHAWVLAPIPAAVFSGLLTFQGAIISENQTVSVPQEPDAKLKDTQSSRRVTNVGLKWHPHHKEGAPKYFLQIERTGLPDTTKTIKPTASFTIGSEVGEDDLPFSLNFQATDISKTKVFVTAHRFSHYYRFDVGVGHIQRVKNGLFLDLLIPEHLYLGYQTASERITVAVGTSKNRDFFPWFASGKSGWSEDWNEKKTLRFKWKLYEPFYLALDGGQQRRKQQFFDEKKNQIKQNSTTFAPYLRLAFETWLSVL